MRKKSINSHLKERVRLMFDSQSVFAEALHEHKATVSRVLNGKMGLSPDKMLRWAKLLEMSPHDLFQGCRYYERLPKQHYNSPQENGMKRIDNRKMNAALRAIEKRISTGIEAEYQLRLKEVINGKERCCESGKESAPSILPAAGEKDQADFRDAG